MELHVTKVLTRLVMPLDLAMALGLLACVLVWTGRRRAAGAAMLLALGVLWACSAPVVADRLRASLEGVHPPRAIEALPRADAIVVLGGGVGPARAPRTFPDLGPGADRVLHAARLYRAGKAPRVIASGGALPWKGSATEAGAMGTLLREWGVPADAIVEEGRSRNTRENALAVRSLLDHPGDGAVLLVTSALHMPRALATFRSAGVRAIPAPTDFEIAERPRSPVLRWLPDARTLEGSSRALHERLGALVYRARGWIEPEASGAPGAGTPAPSQDAAASPATER